MKLASLRVGTRMGIGFAIVLFIAVVATAIGIWNLRQVAMATQQMLDKPLAKERIVSDWYQLINEGIVRTSVIVKSADDSLGTSFAADIDATAVKATAMQNSLEPMLTSNEEKEAFQEIKTIRSKFLQAK